MAAFVRTEGLLSPSDSVLAAVSGGADSVCLAHWLAGLRAKGRVRALRLVHFHHGLRGRAADADARSVMELASRLGVPCEIVALDVRGAARRRKAGLEDAGRKLRYEALARLARRHGCGKVALGHHLDDHAETVLLHLLRGTKAKGLLGIPPRRALPGTTAEVVRPLMGITREEARAYCRGFGLSWREDATNRDEDFTRNWIRRKLLPLLESKSPRLREHLSLISEDLRRWVPNGIRAVALALFAIGAASCREPKPPAEPKSDPTAGDRVPLTPELLRKISDDWARRTNYQGDEFLKIATEEGVLSDEQPDTQVPFEGSARGIAFQVPYNALWGGKRYFLPPYDVLDKGEVAFGPLILYGSLDRPFAMTVLPAKPAEDVLREMQKDLKDHYYYEYEGPLDENGNLPPIPPEENPRIVKIGPHTVVRYRIHRLNIFSALQIVGTKHNYEFTCHDGMLNNCFFPLEVFVKGARLL
ncbi:MAG: tRNA lysidine(34) synthetase TilS [Elusimicrobia bacterium]|nr:tRNA lysidine(34) synthetase TilS [Elusimicrobiota bacterium]